MRFLACNYSLQSQTQKQKPKKKISKPFCINGAHCITIKPFKEKPLIPV